MKAKLKMSIIISVMCLVALCSIVAIIAIFAANTQTFNSNVSVSFKAPGITGKVSANYYIGSQDTSGTPMTTTGTSGGAKEVVFNGAEGLGTLNPQGDIELTLENNIVVFEYIFQNGLGDSVSSDFTAELSLNTSTTSNIKMSTKQCNEKLTEFNMIVNEVEPTTGNDKAWMFVEHNEEGNYISNKYFYVKAEIATTSMDATFSGNFNWELNLTQPTLDALEFEISPNDPSGECCVKLNKTASSIPTDIIIPKAYTFEDGNERAVTEIASYGFADYTGSHIYIPDSICIIGYSAFRNCNAIKGELILPNKSGLLDFCETAFEGCNIQSLVLGKNISNIQKAFSGCNIQSLTIDCPYGIDSEIISDLPIQTLIIGENCEGAGGAMLQYFANLNNIYVSKTNQTYTSRDSLGKECNVIIEKSSKTITKGCANSNIPADDSVTIIGYKAFVFTQIRTIELPNNITSIGISAFEASNLETLVIPDSVIEIMRFAFNACSGLTSVKIGANVELIGSTAFQCSNLTEVIIDSKTICDNLIIREFDNSIYTCLFDNATTIKAKYEIAGIEDYPRNFTRSESQDSEGYWVYTRPQS